MKPALWAATALIATSFTPAAPPLLAGGAEALPTPNVLLCTDTRALGPSQNGHFWGNPFLLPVNYTESTTFSGPFSSGDTEYFIATTTTRTQPVIQRCPVMNGSTRRTGKFQDIQVAPANTVIRVFNCQTSLTAAGEALGYEECPIGGSPDDR